MSLFQVQIRPWSVSESDFVMDKNQPIDPRKTIFVGGVPRPLRSQELAQIMEDKFGSVCYAGIDVDPDLKYPKGRLPPPPLADCSTVLRSQSVLKWLLRYTFFI